MTRLVADQMAQRLGQPFVVETRTGASGNIGAEALARATPDGYTIGTVSMHNLLINPHLFKSLPYHPERDFAWISAMWDLPNVAVVAAQHVPARTLQEFAAWAKARPDRISFGSSGVDTTIHLSPACYGGRAKGRDPAPALAEGRRRPGRGSCGAGPARRRSTADHVVNRRVSRWASAPSLSGSPAWAC
jgi:hypothetical protein